MRRLNTRKRNKINFKKLNKKAIKTISILIILIFLISFIYFYFIKNFLIKISFEKEYTHFSELNEETIFSLDKIIIFSSATAQPQEINNSVWNLNISQYSDIGIYLNNFKNNNSNKNVVKNLYIDNIEITKPEYGRPYLYYKSVKDFGKCNFSQEQVISDKIDFNIVPTSSEYKFNEIDNYLSNPIIIGYYNQNVKEGFLDSNSQIEYNGKVLKRANIPQTSIKSNISFDIHIINELNEEYICNVSIEIPFENDDNQSIYENGYITKEISRLENYKFLRLK